jgi:hypothetical protein
MITFTPVLLLPADGVDVQGRDDLLSVLMGWCRPLEEWFELQSQPVHLMTPTMVSANLDLGAENPWNRVREALYEHPMDGEHQTLCWLAGWDHPSYSGWSAPGLALIGDLFYRLHKRGDAQYALYGPAHEIGHALGYRHQIDLTLRPPDVMWPQATELEHAILRPQPMGGMLSVAGPVGCTLEMPGG